MRSKQLPALSKHDMLNLTVFATGLNSWIRLWGYSVKNQIVHQLSNSRYVCLYATVVISNV